jgi:hypothetical protein
VEKCTEFETAFCDRVASCGGASKADCLAEFARKADCSKAEEVPADFDRNCLPAIRALECGHLSAIPDACNIKVGS